MQITDVFKFLKNPGHFGSKVTGHVINLNQSETSNRVSTYCPGTKKEKHMVISRIRIIM